MLTVNLVLEGLQLSLCLLAALTLPASAALTLPASAALTFSHLLAARQLCPNCFAQVLISALAQPHPLLGKFPLNLPQKVNPGRQRMGGCI
jgi:hypothetical protein